MINETYEEQVTNLNENVTKIRQRSMSELYVYVNKRKPKANNRRDHRRKMTRWLDKHSVTFHDVPDSVSDVIKEKTEHVFYIYSKKTAHTLKCTWWLSDYGRTINYKYEPAKNSEIP